MIRAQRHLSPNLLAAAVLTAAAAAAWLLVIRESADMAMAMELSMPVYMATWLAMLVAMMLPATAPLALAYGRVAASRGQGRLASMPFTAGYLVVWTAAGVVPLALYLATRGAVAGMVATPLGTLAVSGTLVAAGLYQLSPWKGACLRACRSPLGFVISHDFDSGPLGGVLAGAQHGVACLGCCWALMAVLVVVGLMSLPAMAALAVLILAEKNWSHGPRLAVAAGVAMVAAGAVVFVL